MVLYARQDYAEKGLVNMGIISGINSFVDENDADPTQVNDNFSKITNEINGNLDNNNIAEGAGIEGTKLINVIADALSDDLLSTIQEMIYPLGSLYFNADDNTNPGTLLGFGTWEAYAKGRVPVGIDSDDDNFDTAGETGGEKTHTLTNNELPLHKHSGTTSSGGNHNHSITLYYGGSGSQGPTRDALGPRTNPSGGTIATSSSGAHTHSFTTNAYGGGSAHNNLQPYVVVYIWRRTA